MINKNMPISKSDIKNKKEKQIFPIDKATPVEINAHKQSLHLKDGVEAFDFLEKL